MMIAGPMPEVNLAPGHGYGVGDGVGTRSRIRAIRRPRPADDLRRRFLVALDEVLS
jgi:hypothetical protein